MNELDKLAAIAESVDTEVHGADNPQPQNAAPPVPLVTPAQQWAQVPKMFGSVVSMALPELEKVYTDSACLEWGEAMAAVSEKYGWKAPTENAPEIMLVVASLPLVIPTYQAIAAKRRELQLKKTKPTNKIEPENSGENQLVTPPSANPEKTP